MVQLAVGVDKAANVRRACQMVKEAVQNGAGMVVLPVRRGGESLGCGGVDASTLQAVRWASVSSIPTSSVSDSSTSAASFFKLAIGTWCSW